MKRFQALRKSVVPFVIFTLVLSPFQFSRDSFRFVLVETHAEYNVLGDPLLIEEDTVWTKDQDLSFNKRVVIVNGATLTITEGAHVILGSDEPDFPLGSLEVNDGTLRVLGTEQSRVTFTGRDHKPFSLDFYTYESSRQESFIRYAVIGEGGDVLGDDGGGSAFLPKWLIARAFAAGNGAATINYVDGKLHIENTHFANEYHPNVVIQNAATFSDFPGEYLRIINSNFSNKTDQVAVQSALSCIEGEACQNKVTLKNNWFGAATGPKGVPEQNPVGMLGDGSVISGPVILDGFRKKELIADPAIIVPGITGSAQVWGTWKLDPILHSYDDLIASLETNGYESEINLFTFPYDWRRDNETSAHSLQGKVEDVRQATGVSRVDLVAHSMGGLVARAYIEAVGGALYDDTVDQLVTLGTPNSGSPEAYLKWEAGEGFFTVNESLAKHHFEQEAEEAGYDDNLKGYIQDRVLSVRQLLPDYSYLVDAPDTERIYPTDYPPNDFLEELNSERNRDELALVNYTNIVGLTNPENTISTIRVVESSVANQWEHGMPENFYDVETDRGLTYTAGDDTVPEASAKGVAADTVVEISATHGDLPTKAQCEVFRTLTAQEECNYEESVHIPNIFLFNVFSPIDIQIVSPSGKRVGKDFETGGFVNEIDGAYYTGSDTENEFVTIPRPEKGEYRILRQGTGNGEYRVEAVYLEEQADGEARESVATVTGIAETDIEEESSVELQETGDVVAQNNQDVTAPVTESSLQGTAGTNDWYTSNVTVTLAATDNEGGSGVEKTEYSLDNGVTWAVFTEPIVVTSESTTMLQYFSTDKAGNKEIAQTETIRIDRVAPEGRVMFDSTTQKIVVTGKDNLGGVVSVAMLEQPRDMVVSNTKLKHIRPWFEKWWKKNRKNLPDMLATLTDEAGHTTSIAFEKWKDRKGYTFVRVKTLAYDEGESTPLGASAEFKWRTDRKNQYQQLASYLRIGAETLASRFIPKKNETWIRERTKEHEDDSFEKNEEDEMDEHERREWQKLAGLVVPYLETENGSLQAKY